MIYRFWFPLGIFWPLCCLFFYDIQILITPLVSFGHCVVCSSMIYRFWLESVYHRRSDNTMAKEYQGGNQNLYIIEEQTTQWPKDTKGVIRISVHCVVCSSMIYRFWLSPWNLLAIVLSVLLWYTDSDYLLGSLWPLQHNGQKKPRNNQNLYIIEEQKTQWPKDTKGVIRICIS
jgi:hypothetical protein